MFVVEVVVVPPLLLLLLFVIEAGSTDVSSPIVIIIVFSVSTMMLGIGSPFVSFHLQRSNADKLIDTDRFVYK